MGRSTKGKSARSHRRGKAPEVRRRARVNAERALGPERRAGAERLRFEPEVVAFGMLCLFSISIYLVYQEGFDVAVVRQAIIGAVKLMLAIAAVSWVAFMIGGKSARAGNVAFVALFAVWTVGFGGFLAMNPSQRGPSLAQADESIAPVETSERASDDESDKDGASESLRIWREHAAAQDERYRLALEDSGVARFREMKTKQELLGAWKAIPELRLLATELSSERLEGAARLERAIVAGDRDGVLSDEARGALGDAYDRATAMAGFYALEGEALGELLTALALLGDHFGSWSVGEDGRVVFDDATSVLVAGRYTDARARLAQLARAQGELRSRMPSVLVDEDAGGEAGDEGGGAEPAAPQDTPIDENAGDFESDSLLGAPMGP